MGNLTVGFLKAKQIYSQPLGLQEIQNLPTESCINTEIIIMFD